MRSEATYLEDSSSSGHWMGPPGLGVAICKADGDSLPALTLPYVVSVFCSPPTTPCRSIQGSMWCCLLNFITPEALRSFA